MSHDAILRPTCYMADMTETCDAAAARISERDREKIRELTKREDETVTQFTMRRIRNEILEEAAREVARISEIGNKSRYAAAIRALKDLPRPGPGTPEGDERMTQEMLRVCIDRTLYLNAQGPCMETELALSAMRQALAWFEVRAARCRGTHIEADHADALDNAPICPTCGHNQCHRDVHERLPGTRR
jgi:hypothetical protein